jgi:F-type H+-transporting ATPase subunit epsilon
MANVDLEIVTPEGIKLAAQVSEFTAQSAEGEFGVLPSHRPMLAALKTGIVRYIENGKEESVAVGPGFVQIVDDHAVLLTQRFIRQDDVDPVRARRDLKEAQEAIGRFEGEGKELNELLAKSLWAAAQLELYGDAPPETIRVANELAYLGHGRANADPAKLSDGDTDE